MKNKRTWLLAAAALLALVAGLVMTLREPAYGGKTLTVWLEQYRDLCDLTSAAAKRPDMWQRKEQAETALRQLGNEGMPLLVDMLLEQENVLTPVRRKMISILGGHYLPPVKRNELALLGFSSLRAEARAAVPVLMKRFDENPEFVAKALTHIGVAAEGATPVLIRGLTNQQERVRMEILVTLPKIQPDAALVVPSVMWHLDDPNQNVRLVAEMLMRSLGANAKAAVPALAARMDQDPVRTAQLLAQMKTDAASATPVLVRALTNANPEVRREIVKALPQIQTNAEMLVPILTQRLRDEDRDVRFAAVEGLRNLGWQARSAMPELRRVYAEDENATVKEMATRALSVIARSKRPDSGPAE